MRTVYIFGDSLLRGVMPDENGMYHSTECIDFDGLAKKHDIVIKNYAMPTFTSKQGREWMNKTLAAVEKPDLAIVEYGGNDCDFRWRELAETDELVVNPHRVSLEEFAAEYAAYKKVILKLANERQKSVLNIEKNFANLDNMVEYYSVDGMHPNEKGYHLIHNSFDEFFSNLEW